MKKICLVTGVGPGTGRAIVKRFAKDYTVAMVARNEERLTDIAAQHSNVHAFACDVSDLPALTTTLQQIRSQLGDPEVVVHNAVSGAFGDFMSIEPDVLASNFAVNTMALLHLGQALFPGM